MGTGTNDPKFIYGLPVSNTIFHIEVLFDVSIFLSLSLAPGINRNNCVYSPSIIKLVRLGYGFRAARTRAIKNAAANPVLCIFTKIISSSI